jgi:hypothetical protein
MNMRWIPIVSLSLSLGCAFAIRDSERYRNDTDAALATKDAAVRSCYDRELTKDAQATGTLTLEFRVDRRTGTLTELAVVEDRTDVSPILAECVMDEIAGLQIAPRDLRDGKATYTWSFQHAEA